jgi:two-component system heavy metal sensor histidine kinase CusS
MPRRPLSVGARWAVQYSVAVLVTFALLAGFAYGEIRDRIKHDAKLLLELQIADLHELLGEEIELKEFEAHIAALTQAEPRLRLSIQLRNSSGSEVANAGVLGMQNAAIPAAVLEGREKSQFYELDLGEEYPHWVFASPMDEHFAQVAVYSEEFLRSLRHLRSVLLTIAPVVVALSFVCGWLLAQRGLRPLSSIVRTARQITGSHLDEVIPVTGNGDELDQLAETLNEMIGRIRQSFEKTRRFSGAAAHQLRTPLNRLRGQLELALEDPGLGIEVRRSLEGTLSDVEELAETVRSMLQLVSSEAGLDPSRKTWVSLGPILDSVVEFYEPLATERGLRLFRSGNCEERVLGEATWLRQLFANLVENALRYTPQRGGEVEVASKITEASVIVQVRDTGIGIAAHDLDRVFDRFHALDQEGRRGGSGLGLTIAREIARAHQGEIAVESVEGSGSRFTVTLPRNSQTTPSDGALRSPWPRKV